MPTTKIVVSNPKSKTAIQKEFESTHSALVGKKIGEKVHGDSFGLSGFELEITGGSDKEGFPMRKDIEGQGRKRIVLSGPPGFNPDRKGKRKRKSVRGNTVSADIVQVNLKIVKDGPRSAEELWGVTPKKKEKYKADAKKEEPKAEHKHEEHKHEHAEKPKDEAEKAENHDKSRKPQAELAEAKMGVKKVE